MSAEFVALVKRPYTNPDPTPFTLKTNSAHDGEGTLTCNQNNIDFSVKGSANPLKFDGTDNKFQGAQLTAGIDMLAAAKTPSAKMNDVELTLTLTGGSKKPGPPAKIKFTAVEVTLDICAPRVDDKTDPTLMPTANAAPVGAATPTDKFYLGRPLPLQTDPKIDERATL